MTAPHTKQATIIITVNLMLIDLIKLKYAKKLKVAYAEECKYLSDRETSPIPSEARHLPGGVNLTITNNY